LVAVSLVAVGAGALAYHFRPESNVEIEAPGATQTDPGWVRVEGERKALLFRPDGTGRSETAVTVPFGRQLSPDGTRILYVRSSGDQEVYVADAGGKNARKVSPDKLSATSPCWSPDGRRIAFAGLRGE